MRAACPAQFVLSLILSPYKYVGGFQTASDRSSSLNVPEMQSFISHFCSRLIREAEKLGKHLSV